MQISFATQGTCARFIDVDLDGDTIRSVRFIGGCRGNLEAVSRLAQGKCVQEIIHLLSGIPCRNGTSCSDQLAQALSRVILQNAG